MINTTFKDFHNGQGTSITTNPYAVDVIKAKRRDLIYGISHTEDLLDLLVTEGVVTPAKRSIVLTIRPREEQNSRVLDILVSRGERACRKFFHPCLMLSEPDLYQRIKAYVSSRNENVRDTRRQLIGYLLEREEEGLGKVTDQAVTLKSNNSFVTKESKKLKISKEVRASTDNHVPGVKTGKTKSERKNSESIFSIVASGGEASVLEELLNNNVINAVDSSDKTLLHVAAEHGHLPLVELLLQRGARLDLSDSGGHTALHLAASRGHTEVVQALAKAGAPLYALDKQGKTAIQLAMKNQHLNSVKTLVQEETQLMGNQTHDRFLHLSAREDDWELAKILLQSGADAEAKSNQKTTALFDAVTGDNEKTVTILLNAGAKVDQAIIDVAIKLSRGSILRLLLGHVTDALSAEDLGSALFSAVRHNQDEVITALIDSGADVNTRDKDGYTPLLLSAMLGRIEAFRALVAKQAKLDATLPNQSSSLHLAVQSGCVPIVQALLEKGLDPNTIGPKAQTPLHLVAQYNRSALVALLLRAGAQVNAIAQDGLAPLHIASQQGHTETVGQLLQGHADTGIRDRQGRTALHWAASTHAANPIVELLLSAGADPNVTEKEKKTALHLAAMEGRLDAVTPLLSHKAKGGAKDMDGSTPLHYAAASGHAAVVSALLQASKSKGVDERNVWRKTPLHSAAERGHAAVGEVLLGAGAKINAIDNSKDTPLHCAARSGHTETVRLLVGWGQTGRGGADRRANLHATNNVGKSPLQVAESGDTLGHEDIAVLLKRKMFLIK